MHNYLIKKGTTDVSVELRIVDSTDGTPETGVVWNTAGIDLQYRRDGAASTAITEATLAALTTAHTDGGFLHIGNGVYRFDLPDAACASGVDKVVVHGTVTGMVVIGCVIQLTDIDIFDGVRAGLTALPNAAADAAGGLIISDTGGLPADDIVRLNATAQTALEDQYDGTGLTGDTYPASQQQVGLLTSGSAAINVVAESFTKSGAEPETNTYTSTHALDGTLHIVEDVATATDAYYQFDVGGNGVPVEFVWEGYAQSNGDSYDIYAYNYGTTSYEQIGALAASNGTTVVKETFVVTNAHVGSGANLGKVRMRFLSADGTAFATDRVLCSYAVVAQSVGYANGAIWVDEDAANTNTETYVDGTADNPVSTWAAALTLNSALGVNRFNIAAGTTIALTGNSDNYSMFGTGWSLALGGQSIEGAYVQNAHITGIGTATITHPHFDGCDFGAATIPPCNAHGCGIGEDSGQFTAGSAGEYSLHKCYSLVPGSGSPAMVFSGLGATTGVNVRGWNGGATYTLDANCTLSHEVSEGGGTTITTGGGDAEIRGIMRDLTVTMSAAETVQFVGITDVITLAGTTTATVNLAGVASSVADSTSAATVTDSTVNSTDIGNILTDTADMQPKLGTPAGTDMSADIAAIKADTAAILIDTNELQGDWTNGGRLDLILDAINTATATVTLSSSERNAIADAMLDRDMSTGTDSGSTTVRTVRQSLRASRNRVAISGGTLTVYKEDDSTASFTAAVSTTAGDPISELDPAGP